MGYMSDTLTNMYVDKHKSCGGCQSRWNTMKNKLNINDPPSFLMKKAKSSKNANKILEVLYNAKTQSKVQNSKRRTR